MLQRALLVQLDDFFVKTGTTQGQLLGLGFAGGQLRLELALLTGFVLQQAAQMFATVFLLALLRAQILQLAFQALDRRLALLALKAQLLDFLAPGKHATFRFAGPAHPRKCGPTQ